MTTTHTSADPPTDSSDATAAVGNQTRWSRWAPLILIASAFLAYQNSFTGDFLFDDLSNVQNNFKIRRLWPIWETMWGPLGAGVSGRPVVQLSFALNYALHGLEVSGYHIGNLLLHTATSLVFYGVLRCTFASPVLAGHFERDATPLALVIVLVWQVHPVLTDSVTYISGRSEILVALFVLLTLYSVIRAAASPRHARLWRVAAVVSCILGTGCKEVMAVAPLLVLLYDRIFIADSFRSIRRDRGGLYLVLFASLAFIPLNLYMANFHRWALMSQDQVSSWDYLKVQSQVLVLYLRLSVWPHPLIIDYDGWPLHPSLRSVVPHGTAIVVLLIATGYGLLRMRPAAYAGAWFFLILAPTSSVLPLPTEIATERRMYLPLMAIVAVVLSCGYRLSGAVLREEAAGTRRVRRLAGGTLVTLLVAAEILRTRWRNEDYRDVMGMWHDVIAHRPNSSRAYTNLGRQYIDRHDYSAAKECFAEAVRLNKDNFTALNNLGTIAMREGDEEAAIRYLESAAKVKPDYGSPHANLGVVYFRQGRLAEAEASLREVIRLQPQRVDHLVKLARVLIVRGKLAEAEQVCRAALRLDPQYAPAHDQLGIALARSNQMGQAIEEFRAAVRLTPTDPGYQSHLAWCMAVAEDPSLQNPTEAIRLATRAVDDTGGKNLLALDALAMAYAAAGQFDSASSTAQRALELARKQWPARASAIERRLAAYAEKKMPAGDLRQIQD